MPIPTLNDLASEMTGGNTVDPFEAFEQWKAERAALSEFFDITQAQGIILLHTTKQWKIVAGLIWGKDRRPGEFVLWQIKTIKEKDLAKLAEAGHELDRITKRIDDLLVDTKKMVKEAPQLPLFKIKQGEKNNEHKK